MTSQSQNIIRWVMIPSDVPVTGLLLCVCTRLEINLSLLSGSNNDSYTRNKKYHRIKSKYITISLSIQSLTRVLSLSEPPRSSLIHTRNVYHSRPLALLHRHDDDWKLKLIREPPRHWHNDLSVWAPYNSIHVFIVSARTSKPLFKLRAARFWLNTNLFQSNFAECLNLEMIHINLSISTAPIGDNNFKTAVIFWWVSSVPLNERL